MIAIILAGFGSTTMAQHSAAEKVAPDITVMLKNGDEVLAQFDHLLKLTNKKEQKQQDVLEFADAYLRMGLTSCWGDRPDPTDHPPRHARPV